MSIAFPINHSREIKKTAHVYTQAVEEIDNLF